jgi:hypothetical protein
MGLFGWGEKDTSTPQERKDWRDNAKKQMDQQKKSQPKGTGKDQPKQHRPARGLFG